jgi:hypothetical protein
MDPQLRALVAVHPQGMLALIGHKLRQLIPGRGLRWCWPGRLDQIGQAYIVQLEDWSEDPNPILFQHLGVGLRERESHEPLIRMLQANGQDVSPFLIRPAPALVPPPIKVPPVMAHTPGFGFQTPIPGLADPAEQTQAFQNPVMSIVQEGSLNDLMDSIIVEYGTGLSFRAWRSKARYLMAIYRKGDRQKAHLKAGVFFLATRLDFVFLTWSIWQTHMWRR